MRDDQKKRAWREVDFSALDHNIQTLSAALAPGCRLMGVVKADSYGHGAIPVARRLAQRGVRSLAVACLEEGIALRRAGVRGLILILGYTPPEQAGLLHRWDLTQSVVDEEHAAALAAQRIPISVHLALDTGMHRLGIPAGDHAAIARTYALDYLKIQGVFSHLCVSDCLTAAESDYTQMQLREFYRTIAWLRATGRNPGETHIQASYGIWNLSPQPCTLARAGIAMYGVASHSQPTRYTLDLQPVLSLRARVASVRTLSPGQGAGYGLTFRSAHTRRLAAITIGYADGLPRSLSQCGGQVLLHGKRCPIAGRICMDQLLADVTDVPEAAPGDQVTLIGRDGADMIHAEDLASQCGTITNELLSRLGTRLPIVYLQ